MSSPRHGGGTTTRVSGKDFMSVDSHSNGGNRVNTPRGRRGGSRAREEERQGEQGIRRRHVPHRPGVRERPACRATRSRATRTRRGSRNTGPLNVAPRVGFGPMKLPKDRVPYSAMVDRPPLKLPHGGRIAVWTIVNVEEWSIERNMPRTVLPPPYGQPLQPDRKSTRLNSSHI